ncbi:MAG: hypothetical protein J6Z46_11065 [Lachnospiraceae bacterium]|nr:hypothetical protein [Lachnospiraceae bacterium]MBP5250528.1 hypothetical protein [Lachnospiraceae bacterium]
MGENDIFKEALGAMVRDSAYGDQVRHLYDLGYDVEKIKASLDYPATTEAINAVIARYEEEKSAGRREFVEDTDLGGRKTFRLKK